MAKKVFYDDDARRRVLAGAEILYKAVRTTMGPRGRNVIISNCHLYKNRATGLFLDDCNLHQINVVGSHISYNPAGGIVVRGGAVRNLHVGTCDIEANTVNVLIEGGPTSPGATG